jgi:hypothetical protein
MSVTVLIASFLAKSAVDNFSAMVIKYLLNTFAISLGLFISLVPD